MPITGGIHVRSVISTRLTILAGVAGSDSFCEDPGWIDHWDWIVKQSSCEPSASRREHLTEVVGGSGAQESRDEEGGWKVALFVEPQVRWEERVQQTSTVAVEQHQISAAAAAQRLGLREQVESGLVLQAQ